MVSSLRNGGCLLQDCSVGAIRDPLLMLCDHKLRDATSNPDVRLRSLDYGLRSFVYMVASRYFNAEDSLRMMPLSYDLAQATANRGKGRHIWERCKIGGRATGTSKNWTNNRASKLRGPCPGVSISIERTWKTIMITEPTTSWR